MIKIDLKIPDREWDPSRTDKSVGWCAEACIQMALEYYSCFVSQEKINNSGRPEHSDLYMDDIDVALDQLSVTYIPWNPSNHNIHNFISWIKKMLDSHYPVICGVKIYPDEHPGWFLDHFVLIAGYSDNGFLVNTNLYGQQELSFKKMVSTHKGFSFKNRYHTYFARAITGVDNF